MQTSAALVAQNPGVLCFKDAAAGKADDIMQETLGTLDREVLVIDAAVHVPLVGVVDEFGGGFIERRHPREQAQVCRQSHIWGRRRLRFSKVPFHEQAW